MFRENYSIIFLSQDSSVGIATDYRLDGWGRDKRLSLLHSIETSSAAHPAFYPMVMPKTDYCLICLILSFGHFVNHFPIISTPVFRN
jgi:hypothetical protein